jgi:hypothetical protein
MNTKNSSWRVREKTGPLTEGNGDACARVLTHGHQGKSLGRWMGLVLWAPRARCHLSPALSASQQGTGREGEDLKRMVVVTRLEEAWAFGCARAMDLVDGMDGVDERGQKDGKDLRDQRLRLDRAQRVVGGAGREPGQKALAMGTLGHGKARRGTIGHVNRKFSFLFLATRNGQACVAAVLAKGTAIISAYLALCRSISECLAFSGIFFRECWRAHPQGNGQNGG